MIIYKSTIKEFVEKANTKFADQLIAEIKFNLKTKIGRGVSPSEERSWRTTLLKTKLIFSKMQNAEKQFILLEFKIPLSQKRVDMIIIGKDKNNSANILINEIKGWGTSRHCDMKSQLIIPNAIYEYDSHPSIQAGNYLWLIKNKFKDIKKYFGKIEAVSLLPNYKLVDNDPALNEKFEDVLKKIYFYHADNMDLLQEKIRQNFSSEIPQKYLDYIDNLKYNPSENFKEILKSNYE